MIVIHSSSVAMPLVFSRALTPYISYDSVNAMKFVMVALLLSLLGTEILAFVPCSTIARPSARSSSSLFGIDEWRERALQNVETVRIHQFPEVDNTVIRHVPIYLMDSKRVALQGETIYLQFTTYDDVCLFQQAIDCHEGVFGLGFVSSEGDVLYDKISLVEVKDYNMVGEQFGVFLSCQVVGTAMALNTELHSRIGPSGAGFDDHGANFPLTALCAEVTNRAERMTLADASKLGQKVERLIAHVYLAEKERQDASDVEDDRWNRYHEAYHAAFQSDSQGYTYSQEDSLVEESDDVSHLYSWKQLNAISWAAFSTSLCLQQDYPYRLAALDNDCITNRLLLASYWLADVLHDIKQDTV
jgi:hypothetical protein